MIAYPFLIALLLTPFQDKPIAPSTPAAPAKSVVDPQWEVRLPVVLNASCPIMGKPISQKLFTDTLRGRIYICCKSCIKDIQADVELAYRTAFPTTQKLSNKLCPVSGKPIEDKSPRVELQGLEFSVFDAAAAKLALEDAQVVLAKLLDPSLVDVGNLTCPVTGEAVAKNTVVVVGKRLIRLSSPKCVESVQQEPKRFAEKAQAIRAAQDEAASKAKPAVIPPKDSHAQ